MHVQDCVVTSFGPTEISLHGNIQLVLAHPRTWSKSSAGPRCHLLWANWDIFAWHHTTCLGPPKKLITPREGPHHQSLQANRDVFAIQHVNSHGLPKDTTEATSKIYFSLANWPPVAFTYFQYNSILLVYDRYYAQVCWKGLAPILPVTDY
jgi:hypothetical protein